MTTPGTEVPEAFVPPTGMSPPVLGDPRREQPRTRPGGLAEAPRRLGVPTAASAGGGVPPVLANRHHTGPRPTDTQRHEAARQARQARIRRYREILKSAIANGMPEGTSAILEGRLDSRDDGPARTLELSEQLRGRGQAPGTERVQPRPPADQTTRRLVGDPPAAPTDGHERPAVVDDRAAWEVETPGGPVVAGAPTRRRRRRPGGGR